MNQVVISQTYLQSIIWIYRICIMKKEMCGNKLARKCWTNESQNWFVYDWSLRDFILIVCVVALYVRGKYSMQFSHSIPHWWSWERLRTLPKVTLLQKWFWDFSLCPDPKSILGTFHCPNCSLLLIPQPSPNPSLNPIFLKKKLPIDRLTSHTWHSHP